MKAMILGASGMLGHKLFQVLGQRCETYGTVRDKAGCCWLPAADTDHVVAPVNIEHFRAVEGALDEVQPDVVINCIGLVKQLDEAKDPVAAISVNALFPHRLATACSVRGVRLIHLSTDCVFSGRKGNYSESDCTDAVDLYGRTKSLGEVTGNHCLTLRTSMIGREISGAHGLVEWFLAQSGVGVKGYRQAIFSGLTTLELSNIITRLVTEYPGLSGLYHVSAEPINKHDLLQLLRAAYGVEVNIEPDDTYVCDRSLNGARFRAATGYVAPVWKTLIQELSADPTPYEVIRYK